LLKFLKQQDQIILVYTSDQTPSNWVYGQFDDRGYITLNNTFYLTSDNLATPRPNQIDYENEDEPIRFVIGSLVGEYYKFDSDVLELGNSLYIHKTIRLERELFVAHRNISIFGKMDAISSSDIYIGGKAESAIPEPEFEKLLSNFPNSYELDRYTNARIGAVLTNYIELKEDSLKKYTNYLNKKISQVGTNLVSHFAELEVVRYQTILDKLNLMLSSEDTYSEKQWQNEILQIILLLYPKYIHAFKEAPVRDAYSAKDRSIDFMLVDATGNVDIIEIKKPFRQCIVTKNTYRDNYIPLRELSGTVMQVEKYLFHLNKWGLRGEKALTKRYEKELAAGASIKVTNPCGIIIMGRSNELNSEQKQDFEVIKRKYKNVIDILTYDDLIGRLKVVLNHWKMYV